MDATCKRRQSPPQPAGCVTATLLFLLLCKIRCSHLCNTGSASTEPKKAAFAVTGERERQNSNEI